MLRRFRDRTEAGRLLAEQLKEYANRSDVLVLALPRGGAPVGYEIAKALKISLPSVQNIKKALGLVESPKKKSP